MKPKTSQHLNAGIRSIKSIVSKRSKVKGSKKSGDDQPADSQDTVLSTESSKLKNERLPKLSRQQLGEQVPRRGGVISPFLADKLLNILGWRIVGEVPNVPKAVYLAVPHTSNFDALYSIPTLLALDLDINIMGKESLFKNPIMSKFLTWSGIIPINRSKKGTVLQASIDKMLSSKQLHLGLAPEGTRDYTEAWKTGFYYIAKEANVPIVPVALDYKSKQIRFMEAMMPTGDIEADLKTIIEQYKGVVPKHPERLSKPLQDIIDI